MIRLFPILILLNSGVLLSQEVIIKSVNIVDVVSGALIQNQDVEIRDGLIHRINSSKSKAQVNDINGQGKYLIPGLIDAHIHLFQSGGLYTRPDAIDLTQEKSYLDEIQWTRDNAQDILSRYLASGITTTIDVGGPMYNYKLRDSLNVDPSSATVYLTGPLISTYQPEELNVQDPPIIKVANAQEAVDLVRKQIPFKPDLIKIWYIALKPQDALDSYPIIEATVKEAQLHNLPVAVHATELATAKLALKAGADFLVHSVDDIEIDEEFITLMKESGTVISPTLIVSGNYDKVFLSEYVPTAEDYQYAPPIPLGSTTDLKHLKEPELITTYKQYREEIEKMNVARDATKYSNLKKMITHQIPIALGTDAGNIGTMHVSSYYDEIRAMQALDISNKTILKSATIDAASAISKDDEIGSIAVGKKADLLLLSHNPLEDIMAIQAIDLVIHEGMVFSPDTIMHPTPEMVVQEQLNAYNAHHLEAFLETFAEDVRVYEFPDKLSYEGKSIMRGKYKFLEKTPDLHCELVNRTILGHTVIDHERLIFDKSEASREIIAVYKIKEEKIAEVYFIR